MLFLRKLLKLPSPIELGWSDHNSLEDEQWSENPQGKTWQDWDRTVKAMHPVKYWIAETCGDFLLYNIWHPVTRPLKDAKYYLISHLVPKRRYHMLDLRQPKTNKDIDQYRYGWADADSRLLYAIFNLLNLFVEQELPHYYCPSEEAVAKEPYLQSQRDLVLEVKAIHHWWNIDRKNDHRVYNQLLTDWSDARRSKDANKSQLWNQLQEMETQLEEKTDEMITRLLKIRRSLWT